MSLVFSEEFETSVGSPPVGWTTEAGSPVVTSNGYHAHGLNLPIVFSASRREMGASVASGSIFFAMKGPGSAQFAQKVVTTATSYVSLFTVGVGQDDSLTVTDGGGVITCAGVAGHHYRGEELQWTFVQLDATLSSTTISGTAALKLVAVVRLNGELIATGTSSFINSLAAQFDTVRLGGAALDVSFDSVYVYNVIASAPIATPNQAAGRKARISQAVIEHLDLDIATARISQAAIEYNQLPDNARARISQAVIELILVPVRGWRVYEC